MNLPQVGRYHAVTSPDDPEPEFFDPGLPGLEAAMRAAGKASRDGTPRVVTSVCGRVVTHVCTITRGVAAWPPDSAVIPARKPGKERS